MPGFKNKRVIILVLALFLAVLFIFSPWQSPQPKGAPYGNVIRGPNWGIDITGGTQIMLKLEARRAKLRLDEKPEDWDEVSRFRGNLENRLHAELFRSQIGRENTLGTGELTILIQEAVSENSLRAAIENDGELVEDSFKSVDFGKGFGKELRDRLIKMSKGRVDPQGTLGAQFKPIGSDYLLYEVPLENKERARSLLGRTGKVEVFVHEKPVLWGSHIEGAGTISMNPRGPGVVFSLQISGEGSKRWGKYTGIRENESAVVYLDRPDDSILLFPNSLKDDLKDSYLTYDDEVHKFGRGDYYFQVPAIGINTESENLLSESSYNFLEKNKDNFSDIIWLGEREDLPDAILGENRLVLDSMKFGFSTLPREMGQGVEPLYTWIAERACNVESILSIEKGLAGSEPDRMSIEVRGSNPREEAEELRKIISQRLPIEVKPISESTIDQRLSENFLEQASLAALAAFVAVGILVYGFYRKFKIVLPLLFTMASEVLITLGLVSALHSYVSIGLPGLGGLIAVVGTGVDHQIIIADEVLGERKDDQGPLPVDRRAGKAFAVIFSAAATTVAAMLALAYFGFGAIRGFALVTVSGVLVSALVTRPAFARIIGTLMSD